MFRLSGFGDEISQDLISQLEVLESEDIHCIDVRGVWGKGVLELTNQEAAMIKKEADVRGIHISSIGSPIGKVGIDEPFGPHLEQFQYVMDLAQFLQADFIRVFSFYIPEGRDPLSYRNQVLDRIRTFVEIAEATAITLTIENEHSLYGDRPDRCLDLLGTIAHPRLKACFDAENFVQEGIRPYTDAFPSLAEYIAYVHVKDANMQSKEISLVGEGDGEWSLCLQALHKRGYGGVLSLEPHFLFAGSSKGFSGFEHFRRSSKALKHLLSTIGAQWN